MASEAGGGIPRPSSDLSGLRASRGRGSTSERLLRGALYCALRWPLCGRGRRVSLRGNPTLRLAPAHCQPLMPLRSRLRLEVLHSVSLAG